MKIAILIYSSLLALFTILPFIKNDYWIFRVCEYPRWQKLIFSVLAIIFTVIWIDKKDVVFIPLIIAMSLNIIYLSVLVLPFTPLGKKQVFQAEKLNKKESLRIMVHNVLQYNEEYKHCVQQVKKIDPDILLLLETDDKWLKAIEEITFDFEYSVEIPLNNTYGMLLFSKFKLINPEVKYIIEEGIPSIHTGVELEGGRKIQLYTVHPSPPSPDINPKSTERDAELLKIADLAKACKDPVIVIGDLNDVAWSYTTKLFLKMSRLLDPRRGRGMFNTFNAKKPLFRFPLDHAFISTDFKLLEINRLEKGGSDHFPILVHVQYEEAAKTEQKPLKVTPEDRKLAQEKKAKA